MDEYELKVEKYSKRDLNQLRKINPLWAYGEHCDKLFDYAQHPDNETHKIFFVNLEDLIEKTEFLDLDMSQFFTGKITSDYRLATTLERWENNEFVDPPTLGFSNIDDDKISVSDGRHKIKVASFLGAEKIPVAISKVLESRIREIIKIEEIE